MTKILLMTLVGLLSLSAFAECGGKGKDKEDERFTIVREVHR